MRWKRRRMIEIMRDLSSWFKPVTYRGREFLVNADGTLVYHEYKLLSIYTLRYKNKPRRRYVRIGMEQYYLSKMVALAFVENPNNAYRTKYRDGDTTNDVYTNLYWSNSTRTAPPERKEINGKTHYSTAFVAKSFGVVLETVTHWRACGKISGERSALNGTFYYSEEEIRKFMLATHLGKYINSSIRVEEALASFGWEMDLPPTNRFKKEKYQAKKKTKYHKEVELVIDNSDHAKKNSREAYINALAHFTVKEIK